MFEAAEAGRSISKKQYKQLEPEIHRVIINLQQRLRRSDHSLVIIIAGVEGAGKGEVVDRLNRWFDTRDVQTHAFWDETEEELQRPYLWRFWRQLPMRGTVGIMFGSWYSRPLVDAVFERIDEAEFDQQLHRIEELERSLALDGCIFVKLWIHLSRKEQHKRLTADDKVSDFKRSPDLELHANRYESFIPVSERAIRLTDTGYAPWHIIEGTDGYFRDLAVGDTVIASLQSGLDAAVAQTGAGEAENSETADPGVGLIHQAVGNQSAEATVLDKVDLGRQLTASVYDGKMTELQQELHELAWQMYAAKRNAVLLFEGWDAAGKGSAIRRITSAIDARLYRVIPVTAPTDEEAGHHYLWRFWRHIPRAGYITIYDRSWYGRVLVERVEGLAAPQEWLRSYQEINDFEEHLVDHGTVLMKFWLHISKDEQLARFKAREKDPRKQHKITEEDWRNRARWDDYKAAVNDMIAHTSTAQTPWALISGNDKKFARVQILESVCERLRAALAQHAEDSDAAHRP